MFGLKVCQGKGRDQSMVFAKGHLWGLDPSAHHPVRGLFGLNSKCKRSKTQKRLPCACPGIEAEPLEQGQCCLASKSLRFKSIPRKKARGLASLLGRQEAAVSFFAMKLQ